MSTMDRLGAVISVSSNEIQFLRIQLLELARGGLSQVVVSAGDHLYDMRAEQLDIIQAVITEVRCQVQTQTEITLVTYEVEADVQSAPRKYHNRARQVGVRALRADVEWVLLLDSDEVPEGARLNEWYAAQRQRLRSTVAYKLACYWYFVKPTWQADAVEDSIVLVHRSQLTDAALALETERDGVVRSCPGGAVRNIVALTDGRPLFHHYSWVRDKEQLLHKVRTWGHRGDRGDWLELVRDLTAYFEPDSAPPARDFVHGYRYSDVPNIFGIDSPTP